MSKRSFLSTLRFFRPKGVSAGCREEKTADEWAETRCGQREWESLYRRHWQFDKKVRSTHGVNCTGSCSWDVYVKDGILVWETQATDYPACGDGFPNHEPRGCPRGATYSWYTYSPVRLKYPLVRSSLMGMWREAMQQCSDPVAAWESIVDDDAKRRRYQQERGKGGFVRISWDQAATMIAAGLIHTIKKYGPDRIFGFSPIPAMSMVCYASGARFLSLIGAAMISFYDWYCDLPPASPQIWGEQTDVPESADWFESSYFIDYAKHYTDLPYVVILKDRGENCAPGRFLRAADLDAAISNAQWKTVVVDADEGRYKVPNGSIGFRWIEDGRWNLNMEDDGRPIDPLLTFAKTADGWQEVAFPRFEAAGAGIHSGLVPVKSLATASGNLQVTTVFDLMCAQLGVPSSCAIKHFHHLRRCVDWIVFRFRWVRQHTRGTKRQRYPVTQQ